MYLEMSDYNRNARIFWWIIVTAGAVVLCSVIGAAGHYNLAQMQQMAALLGLTLLAGSYQIRIPGTIAIITLSDALIFISVLYLGVPGATIIACLENFLATYRASQRWTSRLASPAQMAVTMYVAAHLFEAVWHWLQPKPLFPGIPFFLALQLLACAHFIINTGLVAWFMALKRRESFWLLWRSSYAWVGLANAASASAAGLIYLGLENFGLVSLLAAGPVVAVIFSACFYYLKQAAQTEQHLHELAESEERFRSAFDYASTGMGLLGTDEKWLQANYALCQLLGYTETELLARGLSGISHPDDLMATRLRLAQLLNGQARAAHLEQRFIHQDGHQVWGLLSAAAVRDAQLQVRHLILQVQDFTARKHAEEQLQHDALHDALTGLPNRALLLEHIKLALGRARRQENPLFATLLMDFDRFKVVNDSLGHLIGDQLLIGIARRLEVSLRPGDTVARLGGDEFAILLEDLQDNEEAIALAERLQREVCQPFNLGGHEIFATVSTGIVFSAPHYQGPEELLRDADTAMNYAKAQGRARHAIFDDSMHARARKLMQLETDMRFALERKEFFLVYQPIISLQSGVLEGFEALVRWQHPTLGLVSPADFIPLAEETGIIVPLGQQVLEMACRQLAYWQNLMLTPGSLSVSVNLSGRQLTQPDIVERIKQTLADTQADPRCLKLEITESVIMENLSALTATLQQLRDLSLELSIDDFGTGYSSLGYVNRLPVQILKIDRCFVAQMLESHENAEIVRTILSLAKTFGFAVVAEGIEEPAQAEYLRTLGCASGQGYLFSKPLPVEMAEQMVRQRPEWPVSQFSAATPLPAVEYVFELNSVN